LVKCGILTFKVETTIQKVYSRSGSVSLRLPKKGKPNYAFTRTEISMVVQLAKGVMTGRIPNIVQRAEDITERPIDKKITAWCMSKWNSGGVS